MFTFAVVGFGARGRKYSALLKARGEKLVAVCDCDPKVYEVARRDYALSDDALFSDYDSFFSRGKIADLLIVATTDREHLAPALRALELGYDVILEKPIAVSLEDCEKIYEKAKVTGRRVIICHVLRYSPFFKKIKQLVDSGRYGEIETVNHVENVGYWHFAHSFVRGNWRNEQESTFMLLAKCCHDLDILAWLFDKPCEYVSSMGKLSYFKKENPENPKKGYCFKCDKAGCPYRASDFYVKYPLWVKLPVVPQENRDAFIRRWLEDESNPYARCVYECDNDVVDHQVVNMQFAGGATAHLTMTAFTKEFYRRTHLFMSQGEIYGNMLENKIYATRFGEDTEVFDLGVQIGGGHGGGDEGLINDVCRLMEEGGKSVTDIDVSMVSHKIAFAAEKSRKANGEAVRL